MLIDKHLCDEYTTNHNIMTNDRLFYYIPVGCETCPQRCTSAVSRNTMYELSIIMFIWKYSISEESHWRNEEHTVSVFLDCSIYHLLEDIYNS
jgi:hypothetical protein